MLARCHRSTHPAYKNYGARGIAVCKRWRTSFPNFLADMGEAPVGLTLERKKNDEDYCKSNCIWATRLVQTRNRRCTVRFLDQVSGKNLTAGEWVNGISIEGKKISQQLFAQRVHNGMSISEALTKPIDRSRGQRERKDTATLEYKGEKLTYSRWAAKTGIGKATIIRRRRLGWSPERIFETPIRGT